jgi:cell division inhibitor SepF
MSADDLKRRGLWTKTKELFGISELDDEYVDEDPNSDPRKRPVTLRLHSTRVSYVSVRLPQSFDDARLAADGLKDGRQQIINLEKTTPEMAERIIDFLNGVTYALNGFVEKVGDRVYMFAPSNVMIDMPEDMHKSSPTLFDR